MSDLCETAHLDCPFERAAPYLRQYLARQPTPNGRAAVMKLHVSLGDIAVEHAVEVTLATRLEHPIGNILDVAWNPQGGGPYPAFRGELAFHAESPEMSLMSLEGEYGPPGGVLGKAFDAALGQRIAVSAVRALLDDLRREIELLHHEDVERAAQLPAPSYPPTYE